MVDSVEPVAKRRKLDDISNTDVATPGYIPLAKATFTLEATRDGIDLSAIEKQPVELRFAPLSSNTHETVTFGLKRSGPKRLILSCKEKVRDIDVELIRACAGLNRYQHSDPKWPLACTSLMLGLDGPSPMLSLRVLWHDWPFAREIISAEALELLKKYSTSLPESLDQSGGAARENDIWYAVHQGGVTRKAKPDAEQWDPRQFYDNVHVPKKSAENSADIRINLLQSRLFPFQRRAVRWLLSREDVTVQPSGQITDIPSSSHDLPRGFYVGQDAHGRICYLNQALGVASSSIESIQRHYATPKGGILSEEMGLGKTVELTALICLNTKDRKVDRRSDEQGYSSASPQMSYNQRGLRTSGTTLIITPPTILEQWKQEIRDHAPGLKVFHYEGIKALRKQDGLVEQLADNDIVITTYNVIAKEVHYVSEKPDRSLRHTPRFEPPKSPLTQILWWRVCLDEAQMVESGVSAAATVARLIPRVNAWAVTGTPLRSGHKDLYGLLLFLHYEPWCQSLRLWNRLVSFHRPLFKTLMNEIAIRHSKEYVREDLHLPPQSRHTITVPFTAIEEQYYSQLFQEMYEDCGLDQNGAPTGDDWDPDTSLVVEKMRLWLTRLRQTCLHPEVGGRNRRALGRNGGPLRSVQQVLDVMIEQNETNLRVEQRGVLQSQIRRAQIMQNAKDCTQSLQILKAAHHEACKIATECRSQLITELEIIKEEENDHAKDHDPSHESEADTRLTAFRQRLRAALEVKHTSIFFIATAYFQLKSDETKIKPESEEFLSLQKQEEDGYEEAKTIRSELLVEVLRKANRLIEVVRTKAKAAEFDTVPAMELRLDYTGIESRKVFEKLDDFCEAINVQAEQFRQLRQKMIDFLRESLVDEDEDVELQGDEYESSTKQQDEMYAYMEALRALFADRSDALTGQENTLIRHEMKQLLRSAKEGAGPAPEVLIKLLAEREKCRIPPELGSLRGIVTEIRALITSLQWQDQSARARAESAIATDILHHAQKLLANQTRSITALEQEVNQFRDTMNSRLDYYRALQKISDTVAPFEEERVGEPLNEVRYASMLNAERTISARVSTMLAKRRYLQHLKTESSSSTPRICTICQCEFEIGTLTVCGHQFCKECIQLWWAEHRTCPVCKKRLAGSDFWDITYKPAEMAIQEETNSSPTPNSPGSGSERSQDKSIYSDVSTATLNEIKDIDLRGSSFGSKVDTITRHLFWLRDHDPGSKAIIFSQYREFLDVLGRAFKQYKIAFTRFDDKSGIERFKTDPAIECFLLHAKAHSAGLNLVVANHVFLCEPLINTAIELQAIARVHRIGQQRATTVWMYLIADTVEESIYDISVARRLAHLKGKTKVGFKSRSGTATPAGNGGAGGMEHAIDVANSMELQAADLSRLLTSGKSGGEIVEKEDLWQCLFGRVKKRDAVVVDADAPAGGEVGRFLRAEAAEGRKVELPTR